MSATEQYPAERLAQIIRVNNHCDAELEPDLLQSLADILFSPGPTGSAEQSAKKAIEESLQLEKLREFRRMTRPQRRQSAVAKHLEIQAAGLIETRTVVFWQLAVWDAASRIDAPTAARELASLWRQPRVPRGVIEISGPYSQKTCSEWYRQLAGLAKLRADLGIRLRVHASRTLRATAEIPSVVSPWLVPDRHGRARRNYPDIRNEVVQVRLFATVLLAARFIRNAAMGDDVRRSHLRLLGHSTDVLRPYIESGS